MSTCSKARHTISALGSQLTDIPALDLAIQGCIEVEEAHFPDRPIYEAAAHMENCAECQAWSADWLDKLYPERVIRRARFEKYCCASMFDAATDPPSSYQIHVLSLSGRGRMLVHQRGICFCPLLPMVRASVAVCAL